MAERRAEPRRRRLHRGDSRQHANVEIAPSRLALLDRLEDGGSHREHAGIAARHDRDDAPRRRARQRLARPIQLDAIVAGEPRLAGALRHARDIGRVADDIFRLLQRGAGVMRQKTRVAGAEPDDIEPALARRHGRRPAPGASTIEK